MSQDPRGPLIASVERLKSEAIALNSRPRIMNVDNPQFNIRSHWDAVDLLKNCMASLPYLNPTQKNAKMAFIKKIEDSRERWMNWSSRGDEQTRAFYRMVELDRESERNFTNLMVELTDYLVAINLITFNPDFNKFFDPSGGRKSE